MSSSVQHVVNSLWDYLLSKEFFKSVYFESFYAPLTYAVILILFGIIRMIERYDGYQIDIQSHLVPNKERFSLQAILYLLPLLFLDTFTIKHFVNTPNRTDGFWFIFHWTSEQQIHRSLPLNAPFVWEIIAHSILATIIYDILFGITHFILHQIPLLYQYIHKMHHAHDVWSILPGYFL